MRLVLDTNIYCDYAEGAPDAVEAMASYGELIFLPSIVLGELHYGFLKGNRQEFNERKLRQLCAQALKLMRIGSAKTATEGATRKIQASPKTVVACKWSPRTSTSAGAR